MFVLDDSGSMGLQHMPDYVSTGFCKNTSNSTTPYWTSTCGPMDPPYYSSSFNGIYYNPAFNYFPPVNADGTTRASQTDWANVQNDPYVNPSAKDNIVAGYKDQYFCNQESYSAGDTTTLANPAKCRRNGIAYPAVGAIPAIAAGYNYPDSTFKYEKESGGGGSAYLLSANPYYYELVGNIQWCSNNALTNCQARKDGTFTKVKYQAVGAIPSAVPSPQTLAFNRVDITLLKCPAPTGCPGPAARTYAAEMTNFANWYAYYRNRLNMMKTGVGRAFHPDKAGAAIGQGDRCEGTCGLVVFRRNVAVALGVGEGCGDGCLVIGPIIGIYACGFSHSRVGAIGGEAKGGGNLRAIGQGDVDGITAGSGAVCRGLDEGDAMVFGAFAQRWQKQVEGNVPTEGVELPFP